MVCGRALLGIGTVLLNEIPILRIIQMVLYKLEVLRTAYKVPLRAGNDSLALRYIGCKSACLPTCQG